MDFHLALAVMDGSAQLSPREKKETASPYE